MLSLGRSKGRRVLEKVTKSDKGEEGATQYSELAHLFTLFLHIYKL